MKNNAELIRSFSNAKILVIGDIVVDRFLWGVVSRISPEAPVPVVTVEKEEYMLGGAANVLQNIYALGGNAALCGVIGNDIVGDRVISILNSLSSSIDGIVKVANRLTTIKTRVIAQHQQVVRFDKEDIDEVDDKTLFILSDYLEKNTDLFDVVVVSDYMKGVVGERLMDKVRELTVNNGKKLLVIDPKPFQTSRFKGATVITPNVNEAELMAGILITDDVSAEVVGRKLLNDLAVEGVLITRGSKGVSLFEKDKPAIHVSATAKEVFDVTGAGDTIVAVLSLGLAVGLNLETAARLANIAAGIVVGKVGTATVTLKELTECLLCQ